MLLEQRISRNAGAIIKFLSQKKGRNAKTLKLGVDVTFRWVKFLTASFIWYFLWKIIDLIFYFISPFLCFSIYQSYLVIDYATNSCTFLMLWFYYAGFILMPLSIHLLGSQILLCSGMLKLYWGNWCIHHPIPFSQRMIKLVEIMFLEPFTW